MIGFCLDLPIPADTARVPVVCLDGGLGDAAGVPTSGLLPDPATEAPNDRLVAYLGRQPQARV